MGELKFIGKRVVYLAVMLFGVATLVFILTKMIPGDPVVANLSQRALNDPEIVAAYRAKHGLDRPLIVQYIYYIRDLLHFDLGTSIRTSRPVLDDLARCYPATLELALFSIVIASVFGILFGIISAIRRNSILAWMDLSSCFSTCYCSLRPNHTGSVHAFKGTFCHPLVRHR